MDWTLNCACHAKGPSDGIGADVKGTINAEQMLDAADRPTRVENCQQVYDVLMRKFLFTLKPIWDKKDLRGVTRRFAFFVPNHGKDAVRRPVLSCDTLEGSKPLRQFVDCKSDSAQILTRLHSCHECEGCRTLSDYRIELDDDGNATIPANTTRTWRSAAQSRRTRCYFPPPPSSSRSLAAT
jgi:hypothetical protein